VFSFPSDPSGLAATDPHSLECSSIQAVNIDTVASQCVVHIDHANVQQPDVVRITLKAKSGEYEATVDLHVFRPVVTLGIDSSVLHQLNAASCEPGIFERTRIRVDARFVEPSDLGAFLDVDASSHASVTVSNLNAVVVTEGWVRGLIAPSTAEISLPYAQPAPSGSALVQVVGDSLCADDLKPVAVSHTMMSVRPLVDALEVTVVISQHLKDPGDTATVAAYAQISSNVPKPVLVDVTDQVSFSSCMPEAQMHALRLEFCAVCSYPKDQSQ
jgi:hypothetical protein